jgi:uracil-DNA glycosylase
MAEGWEGDRYETDRLLLLGESAYSWFEGEEEVHPTPQHARELVREALAGQQGPFMKKLTRGIAGCFDPTPEQVAAAWRRVAFINYVGGTVGFGARVRPSEDQWHAAATAFPELMERLRPRNVIVLGRTMWSRMPDTFIQITDDAQGWRLADGTIAMCWAVKHPSAGLSWAWLAQLVAYIRDGKVTEFGPPTT